MNLKKVHDSKGGTFLLLPLYILEGFTNNVFFYVIAYFSELIYLHYV